jgi:hypothetical protein
MRDHRQRSPTQPNSPASKMAWTEGSSCGKGLRGSAAFWGLVYWASTCLERWLEAVARSDASLPVGHPATKRWIEQRWVLDNIIQANGIDWDQPRSQYWNAVCGIQAAASTVRHARCVCAN